MPRSHIIDNLIFNKSGIVHSYLIQASDGRMLYRDRDRVNAKVKRSDITDIWSSSKVDRNGGDNVTVRTTPSNAVYTVTLPRTAVGPQGA